MLVIEKVTKGICLSCEEKAVVKINNLPFCGHCADSQLVKVIGTCIENLTEVKADLKLIPKEAAGL